MFVTKDNIVKGVIKYAKQEILSNVSDKSSKMMIAAAIKSIELYPKLLDSIFNNKIFSTILQEENGMYNIENAMVILKETMEEYGDFPIELPLVKSHLVFNKKDVIKLEDCIKESANNGGL